jgi:hypothetical protein
VTVWLLARLRKKAAAAGETEEEPPEEEDEEEEGEEDNTPVSKGMFSEVSFPSAG